MNQEQIARFEANIERLVESAFANFFGNKIRAQDIALQLARAMEDTLSPATSGDARPIAPDRYIIALNPQVHHHLTQRQPALPQTLGQHLVMLAMQSGYRLTNIPIIMFVSDPTLERGRLHVQADHTDRPENSTAGIQRVVVATVPRSVSIAASLMINTERLIPLATEIVNVGRHLDNDIILDDPFVSRHHLQLRRRAGVYLLFDVQSNGGTYVNGVRVKEHQLQTGDVIQVGKTQMVYVEDGSDEESHLAQTDSLDPVS